MNIEDKNRIKEKNELIRRSILVSQMQDHPGFSIFMEEISEIKKNVQFQDIRLIKSEDMLNLCKGYVNAFDDMENYLSGQKQWALQKMTDEDTGEEEILNSNQE